MNLRKLPPSMLLALGLACGDKDGDTTTVNACLSPPGPETSTGPCLDVESCLAEATGFPTTNGTDTGDTGTGTGTGTDGDSTFGPCLSPEPVTDSGTGTDTDSGTGTGTGTGSGTGMMGSEPPTTRAAAMGRVLERGALPDDVAARLQRVLDRTRE